jgi:hypothetical protein
MRKVSISTNNSSKAVSYLNKLLNAADTAQQQGKYLALNKVLKEAKRLSEHIRENQANPFSGSQNANHKKAISELQWLRYPGAQKAPAFNSHSAGDYKKVQGEIID